MKRISLGNPATGRAASAPQPSRKRESQNENMYVTPEFLALIVCNAFHVPNSCTTASSSYSFSSVDPKLFLSLARLPFCRSDIFPRRKFQRPCNCRHVMIMIYQNDQRIFQRTNSPTLKRQPLPSPIPSTEENVLFDYIVSNCG